jgi:hypothetical protein
MAGKLPCIRQAQEVQCITGDRGGIVDSLFPLEQRDREDSRLHHFFPFVTSKPLDGTLLNISTCS